MIKYILIALATGALAGYANSNLGVFDNSAAGFLFDASLVFLVFMMGLSFGKDRDALEKMKKKGPRILALPLAIAFGSILGGAISGLILGIRMVETATVSAGFGWYTLAGPLTGQMFGAEMGALGFIANLLRELITIVTMAATAKIDRYMPIAFGGATTMDTTLPLMVHYCGNEMAVTAFASGFALSIMAPFTITAIGSLG
ncbi:lysine exporter LysO family protein [Candidatus Bathyarchaeota archaeon]|nr:lysine exporter LysO family protein [Candidatus Bathyarchaeota archaeon]